MRGAEAVGRARWPLPTHCYRAVVAGADAETLDAGRRGWRGCGTVEPQETPERAPAQIIVVLDVRMRGGFRDLVAVQEWPPKSHGRSRDTHEHGAKDRATCRQPRRICKRGVRTPLHVRKGAPIYDQPFRRGARLDQEAFQVAQGWGCKGLLHPANPEGQEPVDGRAARCRRLKRPGHSSVQEQVSPRGRVRDGRSTPT